jgi:hypothetical protein
VHTADASSPYAPRPVNAAVSTRQHLFGAQTNQSLFFLPPDRLPRKMSGIDTGDTAWVIVSTCLVQLMTPGESRDARKAHFFVRKGSDDVSLRKGVSSLRGGRHARASK